MTQVAFTLSAATTLNSYGYSPHPLSSYLDWVYTLLSTPTSTGSLPKKPVILSITSSDADELEAMVSAIQGLRARLQRLASAVNLGPACDPSGYIAIELNTSCPNIQHLPPPSYNFPSLTPLLHALASAFYADPSLTIGLKLPPYLYATCFQEVVDTLAQFSRSRGGKPEDQHSFINPFSFITSINTLGSSLLFPEQVEHGDGFHAKFALPTPLGGLGGEAIHPIALGNVYTFSQLLAGHSDSALRGITIFGVGGVNSAAAAQRMVKAGAKVVGCATVLGQSGVACFANLLNI